MLEAASGGRGLRHAPPITLAITIRILSDAAAARVLLRIAVDCFARRCAEMLR